MDDEHIVPCHRTIYGALADGGMSAVTSSSTHGNPYPLVTPVIENYSGYGPMMNRWRTPPRWRHSREVLARDRLNSLVFCVFAAVALLIAIVGVAECWRFRSAHDPRIRHPYGAWLSAGNLLRGVVTEPGDGCPLALWPARRSGSSLCAVAGSIRRSKMQAHGPQSFLRLCC